MNNNGEENNRKKIPVNSSNESKNVSTLLRSFSSLKIASHKLTYVIDK